jgi:hypothetical protein
MAALGQVPGSRAGTSVGCCGVVLLVTGIRWVNTRMPILMEPSLASLELAGRADISVIQSVA